MASLAALFAHPRHAARNASLVLHHGIRRFSRALLRVPLVGKLAGANALIVMSTLAASILVHDGGSAGRQMMIVIICALLASLLMNLALVYVALLPVRALEETAKRVLGGDLEARVAPSILADRDMLRVGSTINSLRCTWKRNIWCRHSKPERPDISSRVPRTGSSWMPSAWWPEETCMFSPRPDASWQRV